MLRNKGFETLQELKSYLGNWYGVSDDEGLDLLFEDFNSMYDRLKIIQREISELEILD